MKKIFVLILFAVAAFSASAKERGEGLSIAVSAPAVKNADGEEWISQYFQDSLTSNFARYSAMTVIDRTNEAMILAEQKLSESAIYDDESAIELGKMTAARLVVAGTIQKIGGSFEVNLRVNDIETNEIRAAFNARFTKSEIENGAAVGKASAELLEGLGVRLTDAEKSALTKANSAENESVQNLAKGAAAEKSGDYVGALVALQKVKGTQQTEAEKSTAKILSGTFSGKSVKEKIAFYGEQAKKWNEIFGQLEAYMNENAAFVDYDFSTIEDKIDMKKQAAAFTVKQGVKVVPNAEAMKVWADVLNAWKAILDDEENAEWAANVMIPVFGARGYYDHDKADRLNDCYELKYLYEIKAGLYDDEGNCVSEATVKLSLLRADREVATNPRNHRKIEREILVKSQKKYDAESVFKEIVFSSVKLNDIADDMTVKLIDAKARVFVPRDERKKEYVTPAVLSVAE